MLVYIFLCNMFLIPVTYGSNVTTKINSNSNLTPTVKSTVNSTKVSLPSEGGAILSDDLSTSIRNNSSFMVSDKELINKNKVKPRKGVSYNPAEDTTSIPQPLTKSTEIKPIPESNITKHENTSAHTKGTLITTTKIHKLNKTDIPVTEGIKENEQHKKPLILSYEALANSDQGIQVGQLEIPAFNSSPSSRTSNQIASPNKENDSDIKVNYEPGRKHPDIIMPIVITMLVVPMFAVMGYLAVKRGQEAWKNRHYKRMDFLLDGMYNE